MGLSTQGTKVEVKKTSDTAFALMGYVKSVPEIGADPEKIDVTHLGSTRKEYVQGIPDQSDLQFALVGDKTNLAKALSFVGIAADYKITYPDGTTVTFSGQGFVKISAVEVNASLEYTWGVTVASGPVITPGVTA